MSIQRDPTQCAIDSNINPEPAYIIVPETYNKQLVIDEIQTATKGDGSIRKVNVNGEEVPNEYVLSAMFNNQDFMPPTDQFPLPTDQFEYVTTQENQKSMFNPNRNMNFR